jgi:antitoxin component YwqK of YwqJK toxin-antitoxin module
MNLINLKHIKNTKMKGYHNIEIGKSEICASKCTVEIDRIIWDDGCVRCFYENGHEKSAKVLIQDGTKWNFTERDENGKIIKEWNEPVKQ